MTRRRWRRGHDLRETFLIFRADEGEKTSKEKINYTYTLAHLSFLIDDVFSYSESVTCVDDDNNTSYNIVLYIDATTN